jgi:WD40 repeat protein
MKSIRCFILVWICSANAVAADTISAPRLGYLYDSAKQSLRAIEGIAAASLLGATLDPGINLSDALISADQSYALAVTANDRTARVLPLGLGDLAANRIAGSERPVDRIALSPRGAAAALYNSADGILQIVTGLSDAPTVVREISYPGLALLAISDDAALVLASSSDPSKPVTLFGQSSGPRDIPILGPVSAMAFRPNSHDLLVATASLTLIRNPEADTRYDSFNETDHTAQAIVFSLDGGRLFAAYGDGTIWSYDLTTGNSSRTTCPCIPVSLQPTNGDSVFLLNPPGDSPPFLFDAGKNRTLFVARGDQ